MMRGDPSDMSQGGSASGTSVPKALRVCPEVMWGQAVNSFAFPDLQLPSRTLNFLVSSHLICVKGSSAPSPGWTKDG